MPDPVALLEKVQSLVASQHYEEAQEILDNNPEFAHSFPVVKKLVSNKEEIKIRDSVVQNSRIVQNNISVVERTISDIPMDQPVAGISTQMGNLERAIEADRSGNAALQEFLKKKEHRLSNVPPQIYPEKEANTREIGILDSVIQNSTIVQNNIGEVRNYYIKVEQTGVPAEQVAGLKSFIDNFGVQLASMKEMYGKQAESMTESRDSIAAQNLAGEMSKLRDELSARDQIIAKQEAELQNLSSKYEEIKKSIDEIKSTKEPRRDFMPPHIATAPPPGSTHHPEPPPPPPPPPGNMRGRVSQYKSTAMNQYGDEESCDKFCKCCCGFMILMSVINLISNGDASGLLFFIIMMLCCCCVRS